MANYGEQYGQGQHQQGTDAYGNPVGQTDQYGNPIHRTGGGGYDTIAGTQGYGGSAAGTGMHGTGAHDQSQLRRSYSEDDGMGGRRKKKGIIEKIKEKLPGVGHNKEGEQPYGGGYGSAAAGGKQHHGREKKGMMEKIKEKLPGAGGAGGGGGHH